MQGFPLLEAIFAGNTSAYQRISSEDPYGLARRQGELILERCQACPQISGLKKLASDGGANAYKFLSIIAEVKFALVFASVGASVEILVDDAFRPARYTPDLRVSYPDGFELLVDVVRIANGSAPLSGELHSALDTAWLPYTLEQCVGRQLSVPAFEWATHTRAKELSAQVAAAVVDVLKAIATGSSGLIRVVEHGTSLRTEVTVGTEARERLYDDVTAGLGIEWLGSFGFSPSLDGRPSCGGGVTSAHCIDDETLGAKFIERVETKAKKREGLPVAFGATPYVIAFQSNEPELGPVNVLSRLTGSRSWAPPPRLAPVVPRFEQARSRGWGPLLQEWRYIGTADVRLTSYGAFGDEAWARDVSGVVVLHHSDTLLQWLPNPFAHESISPLRLISLGFPFDMLGASAPGT